MVCSLSVGCGLRRMDETRVYNGSLDWVAAVDRITDLIDKWGIKVV